MRSSAWVASTVAMATSSLVMDPKLYVRHLRRLGGIVGAGGHRHPELVATTFDRGNRWVARQRLTFPAERLSSVSYSCLVGRPLAT